ncbi:MAG: hypothetical protein RIG82_12670 [Phycisphaeraceae bacterium]
MPDLTPQVRVADWPDSLTPRSKTHDTQQLTDLINAHADRLGTGRINPTDLHKSIFATGHQPTFHHPGILAKDLMLREARAAGVTALHIVVDQDLHDIWSLDIPHTAGDRATARQITASEPHRDLPTASRPPLPTSKLQQVAQDANIPALRNTLQHGLPGDTSAQQMTSFLAQTRWPNDPLPVLFVSDLTQLPAYNTLLEKLIANAPTAITAYNRACLRFPEAGISPLHTDNLLTELPLWAFAPKQSRQRVFADTADAKPIPVLSDGTPTRDTNLRLLPRALLLTAFLRSALVDLFIHGTGGHLYDRITEAWWQDWQQEPLAPMTMVTADAYLNLNVPVATPHDLHQAKHWLHHLHHNIARHVEDADQKLATEKHHLIEHMNDDRNQLRRQQAFQRIHAINDQLRSQHPQAIRNAETQLTTARAGVANHTIANRRDWFFGLYDQSVLDQIADQLRPHAQRLLSIGSAP